MRGRGWWYKFVQKVKEILESITGKPYGIEEKLELEGSFWRVYIDREKLGLSERTSVNLKGYKRRKMAPYGFIPINSTI